MGEVERCTTRLLNPAGVLTSASRRSTKRPLERAAVPGGPVRSRRVLSLAPDASGGSNLSDSTDPRLTFERRSRNPGVV